MLTFSLSHGRRPTAALLCVLFMLLGLAITVSPVSADAPIVSLIDDTFTYTVPANTGFCAFDVEITAVMKGTERIFTDHDGNITRINYHFVEQDTFSANGNTLAGDPFTNVQYVLFDEKGEVTHVYEVGVIERVRLPGGKGAMFLSAGRVDFIARGVAFVITPDTGLSGDIDAFCAALAS